VSSFAAVLLAGGASSRMGRPKALLDFEGQPLWRRQMATLQALAPAELFLSATRELDFGTGPWTTLHDRASGLGPLAGVEAALRAMKVQRLVALAVDMPGVTSDFLRLLLREAGDAGIVAELEGFYQGTVAIYPRSILPRVETILAGDDRSFQKLVGEAVAAGEMKVHRVTEAERSLFRNLNRPEDLAK
jgi:molybdopterin-guanine dinucleotide biosynthesis protein A